MWLRVQLSPADRRRETTALAPQNFRSGKHHQIVKGLHIITLYYTDPSGKSVPVNYRIYSKREGKTKNDYFREMITEVLAWGRCALCPDVPFGQVTHRQPNLVTGDAWYSSRENLKFLKQFSPAVQRRESLREEPGIRFSHGYCQKPESLT